MSMQKCTHALICGVERGEEMHVKKIEKWLVVKRLRVGGL